MKLEYVGHKPMISYRGVDFSVGKEDKYSYIEPAAQMINFLGEVDTKKSTVLNVNKVLDESEVFSILYKYRPDFDKFYKSKISQYTKKMDDEILEVDKQERLSEVEKDVLKNNLNFMKEYRLQRATNKLVYEELINGCVELILKRYIKEIDMPFSISFVHVAESFKTSLALVSKADAEVEVMLDNGQPYTRLNIKGLDLK